MMPAAARTTRATRTELSGTVPVVLAGGVGGRVDAVVAGLATGALKVGCGLVVDDGVDVGLEDGVATVGVPEVVPEVKADVLATAVDEVGACGAGVTSAAKAGVQATTDKTAVDHSAAAPRETPQRRDVRPSTGPERLD
jgi:hypothetical protein